MMRGWCVRNRGNGSAGFTLVELLVVIAILGLVASISIPMLLKMAEDGAFGTNPVQLATRDLYTMLRATKIYATTYNVDTALAYSVTDALDPELAEPEALKAVIDGLAMVRRLKRTELAGDCPTTIPEGSFVFVGDRDGVFRLFAEGACVLDDVFDSEDDASWRSAAALEPVRIWDRDDCRFIDPRGNRPFAAPLDTAWNGQFPAHVFRPSGEVESSSSKQRVILRVGYMPDADYDRRFGDAEFVLGGAGMTLEEWIFVNEASEEVWLYTATGRAKVPT